MRAVAKNATQWVAHEHPAWCPRQHPESDDHDPHRSATERIPEDFPSDLVIDAYLLRYKKPVTQCPKATLAALEFIEPGEETAQFLLTFGQLRRLSEALNQLVLAGELPDTPR